MKVDEIIKESNDILEEKYADWFPKWDSYANMILSNKDKILQARGAFNEWAPMRIYMPINQARIKNSCLFSIRYMGKDIGHIKVRNGDKPVLSISKDGYVRKNMLNVGVNTPPGDYDWVNSEEAKEFRACLGKCRDLEKADEHKLESLILDEMELKNKFKFMGEMHYLQPVELFDRLRFQMKVPLSANEGRPKYSESGGAIDILARIGRGADTKLAVMELKKEGTSFYKSAIAQSLIYSACILKILTDETMGKKWWRIFGYRRELPKLINIHSIAMVPDSSRKKYFKESEEIGITLGKGIECGESRQGCIHCGYIFFSKLTEDNGTERISINEKHLSVCL